MGTGRAAHSATLLPDGRVLIAGGFRSEGTDEIAIATAEIFDPATEAFTPTGDLNEPRNGHTATLLPDGRVLISGGWGESDRLSTAELFDPQTGTFSRTGSLSSPRAGMTATLLPDGRVLVAGGDSARDTPQLVAEIYDPDSETFSLGGSLNEGRFAHTATLLEDGRILFAGGSPGEGNILASAEIYDPSSGEFTPTGSLNEVRYKHAAVRLEDGRVLVLGGSDENDWTGKYSSAEIYDPASGEFAPAAEMNGERFKLGDAVVLLRDGKVLVGGGNRQIELYDAEAGLFEKAGALDNDYFFTVLTPLMDGRVLITGGYDPGIQPSAKAWVYGPSAS
jgi:WD40 repeat protein